MNKIEAEPAAISKENDTYFSNLRELNSGHILIEDAESKPAEQLKTQTVQFENIKTEITPFAEK